MGTKLDIERLFEKIRQEKITLFIGSGFSLGAGAPSASRIIDELKKKCPELQSIDLQGATQEFYERHKENREMLISLVKGLFPDQAQDDSCQKALTRIPHIHEIFTTNYDSYIEDAYSSKCRIIRTDKDFSADKNNVTVYKLHGDFVSPENIILTRDDYDNYFENKNNPLMWARLKTAFMQTHVVFIGYSIDDSNIFRMIADIEKLCGSSPREMFMISPNAQTYKSERLKCHNVTWIKMMAEDFLTELEQALLDHIYKDFKYKKVSDQTFIDFCHIHDLNPTIEENVEENKVVALKGYANKSVNNEIKGTFTTEKKLDGSCLCRSIIQEDGPLKGKYGIVIPADHIKKLEHRANGLLINKKEDIQALYLMPIEEKKITRIKIPSRKFLDKIEYRSVRIGPQSRAYTFDFDFFKLRLVMTLVDVTTGYFNIQLNIQMEETYKNQDNALRWIELLDALYCNEEVYFVDIFNAFIQIPKEEKNPFPQYKEYFQLVKDIEYEGNILFTTYYNFTPSRFQQARILVNFLRGEEMYIKSNSEKGEILTLEFDCENRPDSMQDKIYGQKWGLFMTKPSYTITFNEHKFDIKYPYVCYDNCVIDSLENIGGAKYRMRVHDESPIHREVLLREPMPFEKLPSNIIQFDIVNENL